MALPLAAGLAAVIALTAAAQPGRKSPQEFKALLARGFAHGEDLSPLDSAGQPEPLAQLLDQAKYVSEGREPGDEKETYVAFVRSVARRLETSRDAAVARYGDRVRPMRAVSAKQWEIDARAVIAEDVRRNPGISEAKKARLSRDLTRTSEYLKMGLNGDSNFVGSEAARPVKLTAEPAEAAAAVAVAYDYAAVRAQNLRDIPPQVRPMRLITSETPAPAAPPPDPYSLAGISQSLEKAEAYLSDVGRSIKNRYYAGKELIKDGFGYIFRPGRQTNWGVEGLVDGIRKIAAYMMGSGRASSELYVGDLSSAQGGQLGGHKSHRRGRDVDIGFYATDENGRPVNLGFVTFTSGKDGLTGWDGGKKVRFDAQRNWYLVQAILANDDPEFKPTNIFIAKHLETAILAKAPDDAQRRRAAALMSYWPGHDNHLHLRVE